MGHTGDTYERYYTPTHIARDFQTIYFGTPSEEGLIRSVASMGLTRDRRAPTELNEDQQKEVCADPELGNLRHKREQYKKKLHERGFSPLSKGRGTRLYEIYEKTNREIGSTYQRLYRVRLDNVIRAFHESIDTIEIAKQLSGKPAAEVLTLPAIEFELGERATIAGMLFKAFENDKSRNTFISTLARLCQRQETRSPRAWKRNSSGLDIPDNHEGPSSKKQKKYNDGFSDDTGVRVSNFIREGPKESMCEQVLEVRSPGLFPTVPPYPVCLFCAGNEEFPYEKRMKRWVRKDVLKQHENAHFQNPKYQREFECPYPNCAHRLGSRMHYNRHSLDIHQVVH